jgi:hypothetical protein
LATIVPLGPEDIAITAAFEGVALAMESQLAKQGIGILYDKVKGVWYAYRKDGKALTNPQQAQITQSIKDQVVALSKNLQPTSGLPRAGDDLLNEVRRKGVTIDQSPAAQAILDKQMAHGSMGMDGVMRLRPNPSRVVVLEEYIHHLQWQERARQELPRDFPRGRYSSVKSKRRSLRYATRAYIN